MDALEHLSPKDLAETSSRDLIQLFSAFLAVKKGGANAPGEYLPGKVPLAAAVSDFFDLAPPGEGAKGGFDKIYLKSKNSRSKMLNPHDMIDF